jgi:tripartite-type tricarboxylate transporter receptor subunit TctC
MNRRNFCTQVLLSGVAASLLPGRLLAESYPTRPIRFIVPFAAGGSNDIIARIIGEKLSEMVKQPVIVDNRGGAGGLLGTEAVIRETPDGYTLMIGATSTMAANPSLYVSKNFDPTRDLNAIMQVATGPFVLAVPSSLPVKSVKDLIDLAREKPGTINFGSSGVGSSLQMTAELFKSMAKIDIVHVPYKGLGPALVDLVSDRIQMVFSDMAGLLPYVHAGTLRALAVTSAERWPDLPNIPTMSEAGVPGYEATSWYGVLGPAKLPPEIVTYLNGKLTQIMTTPEMKQKLASLGVLPVAGTPEQFNTYMKSEIAKWRQVVETANIKVN